MSEQQNAVDQLYSQLKPEAIFTANRYVLSRTPPELQELMNEKIQSDVNPAPDPLVASVRDGDTIGVAGVGASSYGPAVLTVASGALSGATIGDPGQAPARQAQSIPLKDVSKTLGTCRLTVSGGVLVDALATFTAGFAVVSNNDPIAVQDAAGAAVPGSPGAAAVPANVVTNVKLTV